MTTPLSRALAERRDRLLDAGVVELRTSIPGYERVEPADLRLSLQGLLETLIGMLDGSGGISAAERMAVVSQRRITQGLTSADVLRAALVIRPIVRRELRDLPMAEGSWRQLDDVLQELVLAATNAFTEEMHRRLEARNQALKRANQELQAHRAALSKEVTEANRALLAARNLNAKVIESLSSGVVVVQSGTQEVLLYSDRAEQILGMPAEEVLGRSVVDATRGLTGLDAEVLVAQVLQRGELPLTKRRLVLRDGRVRWVYLSARRMLDDEGEVEGTVVIVDDVSERELLLDSFSRYVSRDVVQRLLARGHVDLAGERRTLTVMFADIRGFTGLAERLEPEQLHDLLNRYFRVMIEAVADHGGFVDKFVGDKVMAIFGHTGLADHGAGAAVQSALGIQSALASLDVPEPVRVGIGINTGEAVLGNVGSEQRMEFTAIGDAVNIADRLQALARDAEILIGAVTAANLEDVALEARGRTALRGRSEAVEVFQVREPTT
ncbi:MAG: PAS domain S-box protein [Myxococcales bacterium]|nr:PAS domain S-box protein [Myxococcales bacterium]